MSLEFVYLPPKEEDDGGDRLEIRTPFGQASIGALADVTPNDEGSEIVESLLKLVTGLQDHKDASGGAHVENGGLMWEFDASENMFQVSTHLFHCETVLEYKFGAFESEGDKKEKKKTIEQIGRVLHVLIPLVRANSQKIRNRNLAVMKEEKENTRTSKRIHLRVPHRVHPRGILDPTVVDISSINDQSMAKISELHEKWLEQQRVERVQQRNSKRVKQET